MACQCSSPLTRLTIASVLLSTTLDSSMLLLRKGNAILALGLHLIGVGLEEVVDRGVLPRRNIGIKDGVNLFESSL